jgi:hypothetical protein
MDKEQLEEFIRKQCKGNNIKQVQDALVKAQLMILELKELSDGSFTAKVKIKTFVLYEANLKKRLVELDRRSVRADLARERYYVRRNMSENNTHGRARNDPNNGIIYHDNASQKVVDYIRSGGNLKDYIPLETEEVGELDYSKLLSRSPSEVQQETKVDIDKSNQTEESSDIFDSIMDKTVKQIELDKPTFPKFVLDFTPEVITKPIEESKPKLDLTVENIQKALRDAGLFKNK